MPIQQQHHVHSPNIKELLSAYMYGLAALLLLIFSVQAHAYPGDLDLSFGVGGMVRTPITNLPLFDSPYSMRVQADGKTVVGGLIYQEDFYGDWYPAGNFLLRYDLNGVLDPTFGVSGKVVNLPGDASGIDLAVQSDGKIITAGNRYDRYGNATALSITRYNSDGSVDTSFGTGGKVYTDAGGHFQMAQSVAVHTDGKIVVAGYRYRGGDDTALVVARYLETGSLDQSFDVDGLVIAASNYVGVGRVLVQSDRKIVIVGGSDRQNVHAVIRYTEDGKLDPNFGTNGKSGGTFASGHAGFSGGALQADGKIVGAGHINGGAGLVRYNVDGTIDTSFGVGGVVYTPTVGGREESVAVQPDGKLVMFGGTYEGFRVARFTVNGKLDVDFGTNGIVFTPLLSERGLGVAGALQPDGKIVAAGHTWDKSNDVLVVRYQGDASTQPLVSVSGRVMDPEGQALRNAIVTLTRPDNSVSSTSTSSLGYYSFDGITAGAKYTLVVSSKRFRFSPITLLVEDSISDLNFAGLE